MSRRFGQKDETDRFFLQCIHICWQSNVAFACCAVTTGLYGITCVCARIFSHVCACGLSSALSGHVDVLCSCQPSFNQFKLNMHGLNIMNERGCVMTLDNDYQFYGRIRLINIYTPQYTIQYTIRVGWWMDGWMCGPLQNGTRIISNEIEFISNTNRMFRWDILPIIYSIDEHNIGVLYNTITITIIIQH